MRRHLRHDVLSVALGLALAWGLDGCGQDAVTDAGARAGGSGGSGASTQGGASGAGASGTGGRITGAGGTVGATGGAVGGTGASPADAGPGSGGSAVATGGAGKGGGTAGAGGAAGAGGSTVVGLDGAIRDVPGSRADLAARDLPSEAPAARDGVVDSALPGNEVADAAPSSDAGITVPPGYKLVWADEFDVDGTPNPRNWNYEKGFARNEELQWYQADNATVKDGLLVIEARKERVANPNYQAGSSDWKTSRQYAEYTSTSMTTSGLQTWQYGRFEMRARIPTSAGMWPAWWTLGVSGEWPSNGEIDIMEYYKGNVMANVACGTATRWTAKWDSSSKAVSSLGSGWASNFHVWRMDWDDQTIDLYLDDTLMNSVRLSGMLNADGTSPFKQKDYMLVNLALGGVNGGDPAGTTFPQRYEVDWIRVFQKQ